MLPSGNRETSDLEIVWRRLPGVSVSRGGLEY